MGGQDCAIAGSAELSHQASNGWTDGGLRRMAAGLLHETAVGRDRHCIPDHRRLVFAGRSPAIYGARIGLHTVWTRWKNPPAPPSSRGNRRGRAVVAEV